MRGSLTTKLLLAVLIVLLILLQYRLWFGTASIPKVVLLQSQLDKQRASNQSLDKRNQALAAEVRDLKSGRQAVEERARNELGMVKKGETFYQVVK
jgi:cell division protein FtsB